MFLSVADRAHSNDNLDVVLLARAWLHILSGSNSFCGTSHDECSILADRVLALHATRSEFGRRLAVNIGGFHWGNRFEFLCAVAHALQCDLLLAFALAAGGRLLGKRGGPFGGP